MTMSSTLETELKTHYRGLKRQTAQITTQGNAPIKIGKDALDFLLYRFIAKSFLQIDNRENIFAHCFLLITWNLMCRAGNTVSFVTATWNGMKILLVYFLRT
eukprot:NODE_780_length_3936_cov_0.468335.p6 type:complete len:102 gc:universal NODE_780_length_3936_cov_0.468335:2373-2068(-)